MAELYYIPSKSSGLVSETSESEKYSKWKVESALETLQKAIEIQADSKMMGFVKKLLAVRKEENTKISQQLAVENKVSKNLKKVFGGAK